jgi:MraZ protein
LTFPGWLKDRASWECHDLLFTGVYEHAIDAKNRLAVPADVREMLAKAHPDQKNIFLYVTPGEQHSLFVYTEAGFEKRATALEQSELDLEELLERERLMFALARRVEIDSQGRIRLPEQLLKMANVGSEVVIIGNNDHLEIRNREAWNAYVQAKLSEQPTKPAGQLDNFVNPRRLMRKPPTGQLETDN